MPMPTASKNDDLGSGITGPVSEEIEALPGCITRPMKSKLPEWTSRSANKNG